MTDQYGPQTAAVEAFLALLPSLTHDEWELVVASGEAAWGAADDAAWDAARGGGLVDAWWGLRATTWDVAWVSAQNATWDAARALLTRDLITHEQYAALTAPFAGIARFAAVLAHPGGAA